MNSRMPGEKPSGECLLTIRELAFLAGTTPRVIERLVSFEIIYPDCSRPEPAFEPAALEVVRKAMRMHRHLGIGWSAMGLVMELIERIGLLERSAKRPQSRKGGKRDGHTRLRK